MRSTMKVHINCSRLVKWLLLLVLLQRKLKSYLFLEPLVICDYFFVFSQKTFNSNPFVKMCFSKYKLCRLRLRFICFTAK